MKINYGQTLCGVGINMDEEVVLTFRGRDLASDTKRAKLYNWIDVTLATRVYNHRKDETMDEKMEYGQVTKLLTPGQPDQSRILLDLQRLVDMENRESLTNDGFVTEVRQLMEDYDA